MRAPLDYGRIERVIRKLTTEGGICHAEGDKSEA